MAIIKYIIGCCAITCVMASTNFDALTKAIQKAQESLDDVQKAAGDESIKQAAMGDKALQDHLGSMSYGIRTFEDEAAQIVGLLNLRNFEGKDLCYCAMKVKAKENEGRVWIQVAEAFISILRKSAGSELGLIYVEPAVGHEYGLSPKMPYSGLYMQPVDNDPTKCEANLAKAASATDEAMQQFLEKHQQYQIDLKGSMEHTFVCRLGNMTEAKQAVKTELKDAYQARYNQFRHTEDKMIDSEDDADEKDTARKNTAWGLANLFGNWFFGK